MKETSKHRMLKKISSFFLFFLAATSIFLFSSITAEAKDGYTSKGHSWGTSSTCSSSSGCGGSGNCKTCGGDGIKSETTTNSSGTYSGKAYTKYIKRTACTACGGKGSNTTYFNGTATVGSANSSGGYSKGDGECTRCNGTGKNYKCTNSSCAQGYNDSYDAWKTESGYKSHCYYQANTLTVYYHVNGGSVSSDTYSVTSSIIYNGSSKFLQSWTYNNAKTNGLANASSFGLSRTGYKFKGWKVGSSGTTVFDQNDATVVPTDLTSNIKSGSCSITMYAVWEANTLSVSYNANGGTVSSDSYSLDSSNNILASTGSKYVQSWPYNSTKTYGLGNASSFGLSRTGYTFAGWTAGASGTTVFDQDDNTVVPTDLNSNIKTGNCSVTMYAVWSQNSYTVRYDANGGSGSMADTVVNYGTTTTIRNNTFTKAGHTFNGWYAQRSSDSKWRYSNGTSSGWYLEGSQPSGYYKVRYNNGSTTAGATSVNGDVITYYAQWTTNQYVLQLYTSDGVQSFTGSGTYPYGETVTSYAEAMPGYHLTKYTGTLQDGSGTGTWTINSAPSTHSQKWGMNTSRSITVYAEPNTYSLTVNPNGGTYKGSSNTATESVTYGTTFSVPNPTRNGYEFTGWSVSGTVLKSISAPTNGYTSVSMGTGNTTLTANWKMNTYYTVTYDANGGKFSNGSTTMTKRTLFESEVDLSPRASLADKYFLGWTLYKDSNEMITSMTMPERNITLYAVYSIPVSNLKEAKLISWNKNYDYLYNLFDMNLVTDDGFIYHYRVQGANLTSGLSLYGSNESIIEQLGLAILLYDHAGNVREIPIRLTADSGDTAPEIPDLPDIPKAYPQTTDHYIYSYLLDNWVYYKSVSELAYEGERYTPSYIPSYSEDYPAGYKNHSITPSYIVSGETKSTAYYMPIDYRMYFDPNGGSCDTSYKIVHKDAYIGELPVAERDGYEFLGWYTERNGGTKISESDIYTETKDTTVYAHWKIKDYTVTYDYWTNGGNWADATSDTLAYGSSVDLSVRANKYGWTFVGWNTDPDATTGLGSLTMSNKDLTLYAIYKRDIMVTYIDSNDYGTVTRTSKETIYNRETSVTMTILNQNQMTGWESLGWSLSTDANASIDYAPSSEAEFTENVTLYGCYHKEVTVTYDPNGSEDEIPEDREDRYYNASGDDDIPTVTLPEGPTSPDSSFAGWEDEDGNIHQPGEEIEVPEDTEFKAVWDLIPEIEAYDRYFTLEDAQSGRITVTELFEKVVATDFEDGTLTNGTDVTIPYYQASDFTSFTDDGSVTVTYRAEDSFGHVVYKTVTVYIVDTGGAESPEKVYIRFISKEFHKDTTGNFVDKADGGLEPTSVWTLDSDYDAKLTRVLSGEIEGSRKWIFKKADMSRVQEFIRTEGYGKYKKEDALIRFLNEFTPR